MQRRHIVLSLPTLLSLPTWAHHGWSNFDQTRPLYLEGQAMQVTWRNPHAELKLTLPASGLKLPADLATRTLPAQSANVDGHAAQAPRQNVGDRAGPHHAPASLGCA
jgi:hypothetical protein